MELVFVKNGIETTAQLYNSSTEAGESLAELFEKNGQKYYVALGESSNNLATYGRLLINGVEKTILQHKIEAGLPYTEKAFTKAGNFTFTVPTGVTKLKVALCGGGGGGMVDSPQGSEEGLQGESSSFNEFTARGGDGAYASYGSSGDGYNFGTQRGTSQGEQGYALGFENSQGQYGSGGNANLTSKRGQRGGGFKGECLIKTFVVTSGQTLKGHVGSGGTGYANPNKGTATNGTSGFILIAYGGDIK